MQEYIVNRPDAGAMERVLQKNSDNAAGVILRLAWQAGLMRDEIQRLTWAQIDFLDQQIVLPDRTVPISEELAAWLAEPQPPLGGGGAVGPGPKAPDAPVHLPPGPDGPGQRGPDRHPPHRPAPRLHPPPAGGPRLAVRLPRHRRGGRGAERPLCGAFEGEKGLHSHPPGRARPDRRVCPVEAAPGGAHHPGGGDAVADVAAGAAAGGDRGPDMGPGGPERRAPASAGPGGGPDQRRLRHFEGTGGRRRPAAAGPTTGPACPSWCGRF